MIPNTTISDCKLGTIRDCSMRISAVGVRCAADVMSSLLRVGMVSVGLGDVWAQGPDVQDEIKNRIEVRIRKVIRFTGIRIPQIPRVVG